MALPTPRHGLSPALAAAQHCYLAKRALHGGMGAGGEAESHGTELPCPELPCLAPPCQHPPGMGRDQVWDRAEGNSNGDSKVQCQVRWTSIRDARECPPWSIPW